MPQPFYLPRLLGVLTAILCACATLAFAAQVTPVNETDTPEATGIIILDASGSGQMPPVAFDHDLHTRGDKNGETCANCHGPSIHKKASGHTKTSGPAASDAATSQVFRPVAGKTEAEREDAYHEGCVSCHTTTKGKGLPSGPLQAECRACHDAAALPAAGTTPTGADGGFDASLHARHITSPLVTGPDGEANCAACHHPVKRPVSPNLEADSCRSCHPASQNRGSQPPDKKHRVLFADVAHKKCISCHQNLPSEEKPGLTCASCHDANSKAGYVKLSPPPRLEAGQPDAVMMEPPQPAQPPQLPQSSQRPEAAATPGTPPAGTDAQASMPPVLFDHKRHEATTESCGSCHHKTIQECSTCHTAQGNPKGGVSWSTAMHTPDSTRSCVGCHETRKTVEPGCAGCHGGMPAKAQPNCAACHQPLPGTKNAANAPPAQPPDALAAYAVGQKMLDARAKAAVPDFSHIPEKLVLGSLSNEFEPATFPHRAIVKKLASGIREAAPGMLWFHTSPDALCASCHHNTPPVAADAASATPRCATCHAKAPVTKASASPDAPPPLKIAYHQQCMPCHTRMDVKPAATDCAGCHALRQTPHKTGGGM